MNGLSWICFIGIGYNFFLILRVNVCDGFIIFAKNRKIFWLPGNSYSVEVNNS